MRTPAVEGIAPFLEEGHRELATRAARLAAEVLEAEPEPADDPAARERARELLPLLASGGLLEPVGRQDLRGACVVREALAAASPLADAVFALQALGTTPILRSGSPEQGRRWVEPALRGEVMTAFAMTEPEAGSDVASMRTRAERRGGEWVLTGRKSFISNAGIADVYLVFASTDPERGSRGLGCFVVPAATPGLRFLGPQVLSAPHPLGEIALDGCTVPDAHRVGGALDGFKVGMDTLDRLRPTVAAAACGMAARALDEALSWARRRVQFGRPLAELPIVRQKLARMATDLDAARLLVYRAAWAGDTREGRITLEAAMAKAFATEAAQRVVDEAVQILGGRGVLADHPVDRLYRSVRALRIYEGATEIQHLVIAGKLVEAAAAREEGGEEAGAAGRAPGGAGDAGGVRASGEGEAPDEAEEGGGARDPGGFAGGAWGGGAPGSARSRR